MKEIQKEFNSSSAAMDLILTYFDAMLAEHSLMQQQSVFATLALVCFANGINYERSKND